MREHKVTCKLCGTISEVEYVKVSPKRQIPTRIVADLQGIEPEEIAGKFLVHCPYCGEPNFAE